MFVLCIMSHGTENDDISGTDGKPVKLTEVYDLLSATKFPAMAGKPKMVILQACSGSKFSLQSVRVGSNFVCCRNEFLSVYESTIRCESTKLY